MLERPQGFVGDSYGKALQHSIGMQPSRVLWALMVNKGFQYMYLHISMSMYVYRNHPIEWDNRDRGFFLVFHLKE